MWSEIFNHPEIFTTCDAYRCIYIVLFYHQIYLNPVDGYKAVYIVWFGRKMSQFVFSLLDKICKYPKKYGKQEPSITEQLYANKL